MANSGWQCGTSSAKDLNTISNPIETLTYTLIRISNDKLQQKAIEEEN